MSKATVFTMPQPTANGPLHVGHLSGPYLAADVVARAARARGDRAIVSTGVDVHQNWILMRAEREGLDPVEMLTGFRDEILQTYRLAGFQFENFVDPLTPAHDAAIAGIVAELLDRGGARMSEIDLKICAACGRTLHVAYVSGTCSRCGSPAAGGGCEGCGGYTSAQDMTELSCSMCGGAAKSTPTAVPVVRMEDHRAALTAYWVRAALPDRLRRLIAYYERTGLPEVPLAYPTDFGTQCHGAAAGMRVDPYVEIALTDFYGIARAFDPHASTLDAYLAAYEQVEAVWHCHGIDNAFIYSILWPALWAAAGLDPVPQAGVVANEFATLDGFKFSTSRLHAIWANDLLTSADPEIVRLYLAWDRPDRYGSDFTTARFEAFRDRVQPLLDGTAATRPMPSALLEAERERGWAALRPDRFDLPLAARCLITLLEAGDPQAGGLREALTGRA